MADLRIIDVSSEQESSRGNTYYTATFAQKQEGTLGVQRSCSRSFKGSNGSYEGVPRQSALAEGADVSDSAEITCRSSTTSSSPKAAATPASPSAGFCKHRRRVLT